jgi:hypothetical protein
MDMVIKVVKVITVSSLQLDPSRRRPILISCLLLFHTSNAGENGDSCSPVSTMDPL